MADPRADVPSSAHNSDTVLSMNGTLLREPARVTPERTTSDDQRETRSNGDEIRAKDDDDAALVALKYSMAQNELREMVQALYVTLDAHEQRADASKKEAAQLKDKHERWKQEAQLEREHARKQAQQYQRDLIWANQQMQQAQMQKAELEAENRRLNTQLEEKDRIIDQLNQQLTDLISKQCAANYQTGESLGSELEQVAADFSTKEREVYNNMLYAECRSFFEKGDSLSLTKTRLPGSTACRDPHGFQQDNADLNVENQALMERCKHFSGEIKDAKAHITELTEQNESLKKLITRFEESAEDGTQTIEFLQESLVKLCDQIASERQHHESTLAIAIDAAQEKEHQLVQDIQQLQQKLHDSENTNEADAVTMMLERLETERQAQHLQKSSNQKRKKDSCKSTKCHKKPRSTHPSTINSRATEHATATSLHFQERAPCAIKSTEVVDEIEDAEDDEVSSAAKAQVVPAASKIVIQPATTICRSCGAKPFGFMVKCQKCKDPFHARCVKPPDGKRRVSHVFKCSACTLQRPTKVIRRENSTSVAPDAASKWSRRPAAIFSPLPPPSVSRPRAVGEYGPIAEELLADSVASSTP